MIDKDTFDRRTVLKATSAAASAALIAGCSSDSGNGNGDGGNGNGGNGNGNAGGNGNGDTGGNGDTTTEGGSGQTTVAAGPDGQNVFEPEEVTISVGDTVVWEFESPGHNVVAYPDGPDQISIPDGAEGFGNVEEGGDYYGNLVEEGGTYEHTFETAGEFTYVCAPHAGVGMVGTVVVEE